MTNPDLRQLVAATAPEDLPTLVGKLAEAQAVAMARLSMAANGNGPEMPEARDIRTWITPTAAAVIAGLPTATPEDEKKSIRRVYAWAKKAKRWSTKPSARCLRIEEEGFRKWLAAQGR